MGDLDSLLKEIRHHTPNAPEIILSRELRNSSVDFLSETFVWKTAEVLTADGTTTDFNLTIPDGAILLRVESITEDGIPYEGHTSINFRPGSHRTYMVDGNTVKFARAPLKDITVVFSLANSRSSKVVPEFVIEKYGPGIVFGAIARVCAYPERAWTSDKLVQYGLVNYQKWVRKATAEAQGENTRIVRKTKFSW